MTSGLPVVVHRELHVAPGGYQNLRRVLMALDLPALVRTAPGCTSAALSFEPSTERILLTSHWADEELLARATAALDRCGVVTLADTVTRPYLLTPLFGLENRRCEPLAAAGRSGPTAGTAPRGRAGS